MESFTVINPTHSTILINNTQPISNLGNSTNNQVIITNVSVVNLTNPQTN
jgi:hypothetical protein